MSKFRIPRKEKKKFKRGFFLYPSDEEGNSLMGFPKRNQKDYTAFKQGILKDRFKKTKAERKQASIEWNIKYNTPAEMTDKELLNAVNDAFAEEYREKAYNLLLKSKSHPIAVTDYYTFVNAYNLNESSICCMTMDSAEDNLMRSKPRKS